MGLILISYIYLSPIYKEKPKSLTYPHLLWVYSMCLLIIISVISCYVLTTTTTKKQKQEQTTKKKLSVFVRMIPDWRIRKWWFWLLLCQFQDGSLDKPYLCSLYPFSKGGVTWLSWMISVSIIPSAFVWHYWVSLTYNQITLEFLPIY